MAPTRTCRSRGLHGTAGKANIEQTARRPDLLEADLGVKQ
jgi:hypothetical protein